MLESEFNKSMTVVVIEVNNESYILEVNEVKEIIVPGEKIIPVPLADSSIIGIIDIRGEIYTIVSLKQKIKKTKTELDLNDHTRILLLEVNNLKIALLVDSVKGVRELPVSVFKERSAIIETNIDYRYIRAIGVHDDETFIMINPTSLIEPYLSSYGGDFTDFEFPRMKSPLRNNNLPERYDDKVYDEIIIPSKGKVIPKTSARGRGLKPIQGQVHLTADQKDLLKEIGNIGSGNAVTALSRLIKKKIDLNLTDVGLISFDKLEEQFSSPKEKVCGIFCHIEKPSQSTILQVFDFNPLMGLVADLTGNQSNINPNRVGSISDLDEYAISTITEMGNIMAGHYASALADLTGQKMMIDIPELAMCEASQLGEFLTQELKSISDYIIIIQTSIRIIDMKMKGLFFFIPDLKTLENLFKRLGLEFKGPSKTAKSAKKVKEFDLKDFTLKEIQRDALQEVGNIGAGNAANALAQMINKRVTIDIPAVEMVELDKYADTINKKNVDLLVLWSNVTGKTRATVLTLFNVKDIINLTSIIVDDLDKKEIDLRKKINTVDDFPELYLDAMKELGHILGSHYTNAIGDLLEIKLMTDPPDLSLDNGKKLFTILKEEIGLLKKLSLVITTNVIITDYKTTGTFLFIPNTETLEELIIALDNFYS